MAKRRRRRAAAPEKINKAEMIRQVAKALGKKVRPRDIIATLRGRGVVVTHPQVSKTLKAAGYRRRRRGKKSAPATAERLARKSTKRPLDLEALIAAKALVEKLGGIAKVEAAISVLKKLQ
jgi:hypothetical protein